MKVKNIMFSGVMAAILGATGANAAINVASQGYVDSKVGAVETNITNNYLSKTDAEATYLTETQVQQEIKDVVGDSTSGVVADVAANKAAIATLGTTKANATDVYTKTEADGLLANKANATDVYTKTEANGLLANKANAADVYTKGEADELLATKADLDDVYKKTETYTQTQVNELIGDIQSGGVDLKGYVKESTYNEGMALKADKSAVEAITTSLTNYATNEALNAVKTTADAAATKDYVDTEFAKYTTTEGLTTKLADYAKQVDLEAEVTARDTAVKAVDDKLADYTKTDDLDKGFVSETEMTAFKTDNSAAIADAKKAGTDAQATADTNAEAISGLESDLRTKITMPEVCATTNCVLSTIGGTVQWVPLTEPLQ